MLLLSLLSSNRSFPTLRFVHVVSACERFWVWDDHARVEQAQREAQACLPVEFAYVSLRLLSITAIHKQRLESSVDPSLYANLPRHKA